MEYAESTLFLDEGEDAFFIADNDVYFAIVVEVGCGNLAAYAGVVVDEVGLECDAAILVASGAEPIEHGGIVGTWVSAIVGEEALARDDVFDAIAIDICTCHGVWLAEANSVGVVGSFVGHDVVAFEADLVVRFDLLIPSEPVGMSIEGGDYIFVSIAIYIVGKHLCSALFWGEWVGVKLPWGLTIPVLWLLPPASLFKDVC